MEESKQTPGIHSHIKMPFHGSNISREQSVMLKETTFAQQGKEKFFLGSCGKAEEISEKPFTVDYSEFKLSVVSELFPKHLKQQTDTRKW